jgi:Peptidase family C25/Propeptide_C25
LASPGARAPALLALLIVLLLPALSAAPASAQKLKQPGAAKSLRVLVRQTNALPAAAAPKAKKQKLARAAKSARRTARGRPCASVRQLARYRGVLRGIRVKKGRRFRRATNRLAALGPAAMNASRALLAKRATRRCGGGTKPSKLESARFRILKNDTSGMRLRVQLPALRFVNRVGGGRTWTKLVLPRTDSPGRAGTPGIPMVSDILGVPAGATLDVDATRATSYTIQQVDVFPNQREAVDQSTPGPGSRAIFASPPFTFDPSAYRRAGTFPADAADGRILGQSRDLTLGNLRVPAAQYDARKKTLKVLNSVDVTIRFEGGSHSFSDQLGSPWEQPQRRLAESLLNGAIVRRDPPFVIERCGEEMMVITDPSTLAAANQLAVARRAAGIRTNVFQTGAAPGHIGTTPTEIQAFIRGRLTAADCIHPSYVTLMGDDELVPVFPGIGGIESDLEYSLRDSADELPDVALGRIVGNDAAALTTAVTKIVNYENSPPGGAWLRRASIAAEFQDDEAPDLQEDRTFITFAETVRTGILNTPGGFGLSVDRLYATYPHEGVDPQRFNDGTDLPPALKKPTFAWDASTADISAAWNEGRFLFAHRGHGNTSAWDTPFFHSTHADALTNGAMLPVVLSINCSSGGFQDNETAWGTQALVNPNGGAVGVFGDTEVSPTWHNTQIAFGFADALLPRVLPAEGPAEKQRVGDALVHGKNRLAGISPPTTDGNTRNELYLWHYFGDPSMQMWGGDPVGFPDLTKFRAVFRKDFFNGPPRPDPPPYSVVLTLPGEFNGQAASLIREGQVIGKAVVTGGQAAIPAHFGDAQPSDGDLRVAMEADGSVPVSVPVEGAPAKTTLSATCPGSPQGSEGPMTTSGKLEPGFAGAKVVLRYTPPSGTGQPFERTVTTDAKGNWSDSVVPSDDGSPNGRPGRGAGNWRIEPRFDGDAGHAGSAAQACTVTVVNVG